jgi:hypothetical protein
MHGIGYLPAALASCFLTPTLDISIGLKPKLGAGDSGLIGNQILGHL